MVLPALAYTDARHPNPELEAALQRIYGLHRKEMDFRLDSGPYIDLLAKLGNPHLRLPPTIHLAGTNGKGSTIAMLRALAEAHGQTIHAYTSPHLLRFNERLRVSGHLISDDALLEAINHLNAVNGDAPVTFFEFTTALAFYLFANNPADLCLLETGMGGRLDCSNVIQNPVATIITPIGYDHMEFLGNTVTAIAGEKAGILKPNVPCIVTKQNHAGVLAILQAYADELHCPFIVTDAADISTTTSLLGAHQRDNLASAIAAYRIFNPAAVIPDHLEIDWPGRFQRMHYDGQPLIYDGAHNADSFRVLAETLKDTYPGQPITLILCMQAGKNADQLLAPFGNITLYTVDLPGGRKPQTGAELAAALSRPVAGQFTDMGAAITAATARHPGAVMVITGSLYAAQLIPERYWPKL